MEAATAEKLDWGYRSVMEQQRDSIDIRMVKIERQLTDLVRDLQNGNTSPKQRLRDMENALSEMSMIVNGDQRLGVRPLRADIQDITKAVDTLNEYINRAKWLVGLVGGIGGLQLIDLLRSILQ